MRKIAFFALFAGLAACTPVKERALEECLAQAPDALPAGVDGEKVCSCVTKDIADDASIDEAKKAMASNMMVCAREAASDLMSKETEGLKSPNVKPTE